MNPNPGAGFQTLKISKNKKGGRQLFWLVNNKQTELLKYKPPYKITFGMITDGKKAHLKLVY